MESSNNYSQHVTVSVFYPSQFDQCFLVVKTLAWSEHLTFQVTERFSFLLPAQVMRCCLDSYSTQTLLPVHRPSHQRLETVKYKSLNTADILDNPSNVKIQTMEVRKQVCGNACYLGNKGALTG